jgi:hypothetical protein
MRNFKLSIDLSDLQADLKKFKLKEFSLPFSIIFIEENNPDDACYELLSRLMKLILSQDNSIGTRIICRKIRKLMRIDKIQSL